VLSAGKIAQGIAHSQCTAEQQETSKKLESRRVAVRRYQEVRKFKKHNQFLIGEIKLPWFGLGGYWGDMGAGVSLERPAKKRKYKLNTDLRIWKTVSTRESGGAQRVLSRRDNQLVEPGIKRPIVAGNVNRERSPAPGSARRASEVAAETDPHITPEPLQFQSVVPTEIQEEEACKLTKSFPSDIVAQPSPTTFKHFRRKRKKDHPHRCIFIYLDCTNNIQSRIKLFLSKFSPEPLTEDKVLCLRHEFQLADSKGRYGLLYVKNMVTSQ
jgi:hypothetical protein